MRARALLTLVAAGARASVQGRALYESLGWTLHAPLASFVYGAAAV